MDKIKQFLKTSWSLLVNQWNEIIYEFTVKQNLSWRLFAFIFLYLMFSLVGAYNFAHLTAFIYIIWLLEKNFTKE